MEEWKSAYTYEWVIMMVITQLFHVNFLTASSQRSCEVEGRDLSFLVCRWSHGFLFMQNKLRTSGGASRAWWIEHSLGVIHFLAVIPWACHSTPWVSFYSNSFQSCWGVSMGYWRWMHSERSTLYKDDLFYCAGSVPELWPIIMLQIQKVAFPLKPVWLSG